MNAKTASLLGAFAAVAFASVSLLVPGCGSGASADDGANALDASADVATEDATVILGIDAAPEKGCSGYPGQDPSKLTGNNCCTTAPSHCLPKTAIPASLDSAFNACTTGTGNLCVPDTIIQAGSEYVPTSCTTTLINFTLAGVCLSTCITLVSNNSDESLLKQETCVAGELCVPCLDPLTNQPTGACTIDTLICGGDAGPVATSDGGGGPTCPYTGPPIIDPTSFQPCTPACSGAHCLPAALVPKADQAQLATCTTNGAAGFCAPDTFIQSDGQGVSPTCVSVAGSEGRCLSTCLPEIASEASLLPQSTCAAGTKCAPCYDPVAADASAPTGACSLACDKPAKPPTILTCPYTGSAVIDPSTFPPCSPACAGAHCVPSSLVPVAEQSELAACPGGFCAPDSITETAGEGVPPTCISVAGSEGRCLSTCLPEIASEAELLPQAMCANGTKCAPCYNPTAADPKAPTGACSLACDKPTQPPVILTCPYTGAPIINPLEFPDCSPACGGAHCVPSSLVPAGDQSQLATCPGGFCAPDSITETAGFGVPATCTSIAGSEGRCLSTCLPEIASEADVLPQSTCPSGEKCAPCYNPTAADPKAPTGACNLGCDKPAQPPTIITCPWTGPPVLDPTTLPACDNGGCAGAHCLPKAEVPVSVQSQLATCNGGAGFCAPDVIISTGDNLIPTSCDPFPGSNAPGRCLSDCLPAVQKEEASGTLVQSTCTTGQYCVPCNDPFTGASTGACTLGCDTPPATPFTFPKCCNDGGGNLTGTCVPTAQVPSAEQSELSQSGNGNSSPCPASGASYLCVPDEYLPAPYNSVALQGCPATFLNLCGTCVSECIVNSELDVLGSSNCAANHKCVPCDIASGTPGCSTFCP